MQNAEWLWRMEDEYGMTAPTLQTIHDLKRQQIKVSLLSDSCIETRYLKEALTQNKI